MENINENREPVTHNINANNPSHYMLLTIGIAIMLIGVLVRFFANWEFIDHVANFILVIGVGLCLRAVYNILR